MRAGLGPESKATGAVGIAAASLARQVAARLRCPPVSFAWGRASHTQHLLDGTTDPIMHAWQEPQQLWLMPKDVCDDCLPDYQA